MSGPNTAPKYPPILPAPTGASFYLLQLDGVGAENITAPVHLLITEPISQNQNVCSASQNTVQVPGNIITTPVPSNNVSALLSSAKPLQTTEESVPSSVPPKLTILSNKSVELTSNAAKNPVIKDFKITKKDGTVNRKKRGQKAVEKLPINKPTATLRNFFHIPDREALPRALAVLPTCLEYRRGFIYPKKKLPPKVRLGPVEGVIYKISSYEAEESVLEAAVTNKPIFLKSKDEDSVTYINVSNKETSNWLSLLQLGNNETANIWLCEEDGELYGVTTELISSRTPLAIGYSKRYADEHQLPRGQPILDVDEALSQLKEQWWCFECRREHGTPALLQRHNILYHKEKNVIRKYRCKHCLKTFSRLFTFRRHMSQFCDKKPTKLSNTTAEPASKQTSELQEMTTIEAIIPQNTEENRLPSDESFQNYSTGLDFSTNLFDTDRIPNLDISGSSKSENDFNPYSGMLKFDSFDNSDEYNKFSEGLLTIKKEKNETKDKSKDREDQITVTCPQCKQNMTKARKRRHIRECPARRFKCECGRVYRSKQNLAQHIFTEHNPARTEIKQEDDLTKEKDIEYKCDQCKFAKFKRRGMLVNHLWRVHKLTGASVPMERREKHYPCCVCPKLYLSARKRDLHVHKHHPGVSIRAAPIEGERRRQEPAKCSACPRQYVTRAKLLQHVRAVHPHLASKPAILSKKTSRSSLKCIGQTFQKDVPISTFRK